MEEKIKENAIHSGTVFLNPIQIMEAYHKSKVEAVSDEEIDKFSKDNITYFNSDNLKFSKGAKWLKNKLLNK